MTYDRTKPKSEYSQKLRDPRWQKKRLEIMQRDKFTCQECLDDASTLNVHHCYYEKGKSPWEYDDGSLITLCETCHQEEANALQEKIYLCNELSKKGVRAGHFGNMMIAVHENPNPRFDEYDTSGLAFALSDSFVMFMLFQWYLIFLDHRRESQSADHTRSSLMDLAQKILDGRWGPKKDG